MSAVQALGRALLLLLVRLLYPKAPKPPKAIDPREIRKVLVIRTDPRVGNVLLTTPLVRALRRGLPQARVDWLVASGKERLVEGLADRVLPFRKKDFFTAPLKFWRLVASLKAERYDVVVEAGHWHAFSFTSLWLARATGSPVRIGHARGQSDLFLTHEVAHDPKVDREVPAKLELLAPLGVAPAGEDLETTVDRGEAARDGAQAVLAALAEWGSRLASINVGARKADHRWAPEAFGRLAAKLALELDLSPLVLWGPGEEALAKEVVVASEGKARLAPPTDLAALAGLFRKSALVVTNDTGPMHLAVATGAPVVAVLLAQDGARWSHPGRFMGVPVAVEGRDEDVARVVEAARKLLG
jgi:ADP-heptose:LPS heptosyltransferase